MPVRRVFYVSSNETILGPGARGAQICDELRRNMVQYQGHLRFAQRFCSQNVEAGEPCVHEPVSRHMHTISLMKLFSKHSIESSMQFTTVEVEVKWPSNECACRGLWLVCSPRCFGSKYRKIPSSRKVRGEYACQPYGVVRAVVR